MTLAIIQIINVNSLQLIIDKKKMSTLKKVLGLNI